MHHFHFSIITFKTIKISKKAWKNIQSQADYLYIDQYMLWRSENFYYSKITEKKNIGKSIYKSGKKSNCIKAIYY